MKPKLILLILFLQTACSYSQSVPSSASKEIKDAIVKEFNKWLVKSDFETNAEYEARIKNNADKKLKIITKDVMRLIKEKHLEYWGGILTDKYDAEDETFLVSDVYQNNSSFYVKIPRSVAPTVSRFIKPYERGNIKIIKNNIAIINDKWTITDAYIIFCVDCNYQERCSTAEDGLEFKPTTKNNGKLIGKCGKGSEFKDFEIKDFKEFAKSNILPKGVYYCKWNISEQPNYDPASSKPISFTLADLNITIPTQTINTPTENTAKPQVTIIAKPYIPDLDMNNIHTKNKNPNAFAVVIGNKDYQHAKNVDFAINDARAIREYLVHVLGYSEGNIFYIENATKSNFETYFGTKENPEGKLYNNIKQGISDVFVYYSGHGAPSLKNNKGYFVPIDCDPQYVEQGGYPLDLFYLNLSKLNAKNITVITDACFSGTEIFNNISPVKITVSNPIAIADNCVVLSSSTGSQVSSWYNDKQHGMFTYFFLKSLQDKEKSDKNKDNKLTFKEIFEYVSDKTEGVPYYARSIHGVDQMPTIQGTGIENIFIEYK